VLEERNYDLKTNWVEMCNIKYDIGKSTLKFLNSAITQSNLPISQCLFEYQIF